MALVQTLTKGTTGTSLSTSLAGTWGSNTTTGNTIIVGITADLAVINSITSITDSQNNTYSRIASVVGGIAIQCDVEIWYARNITGGTTPTITVNYSSTDNVAFIAREYSGVVTASDPLDVSSTHADNSSTSQSSGATGALAQIAEIVVGVTGNSGTANPTYSAGSSFSNLSTISGTASGIAVGMAMEDMSPTSTAGQTATFSTSSTISSGTAVATFKVLVQTFSVSDLSTVTDIGGVLKIQPPDQIPQIEFTTPDDSQLTVLSGNFYNVQPLVDGSGASDQIGYVIYFNTPIGGTGNQSVSASNNAAMQGLTAMTVEAWVYPVNTTTTIGRIASYEGTANTGFFLAQISNYRFQAQVGNGTTMPTVSTSNNAVTLNQWNHVALTWDGTTITIWVNGVSKGTGSLSGGNTGNPAQNFFVGNSRTGARAFPGLIKEVRWSKNARYTSGFSVPTAEFSNDANTVGLWHFDDGSGTSATDSSSNTLTGTLNGSPQWVTSTAPITGFNGTVMAFFPVVVNDSSTVTENISFFIPLKPSVFDSSTVTDVPTVLIGNFMSVSDSSAVTESTTALNIYTVQPLVEEVGASDQTGFALYFSSLASGAAQPTVTVSNNAALQSLTAITVEAWIYVVNTTTTLARILNYGLTSNQGYVVYYLSNQQFRWQIGNGTTSVSFTTLSNAVPLNQWTHIACTWDGSNAKIWVSGTQQATQALAGGNTGNPASSLTIGNTSSARVFPGIIKELRISNTARYTATFSVPTAEFSNDANTVALWHFDDGTGTSATDSSSNNLTGTFSGSPNPQWVASTAPITGFNGSLSIFIPPISISVSDSSTVTENISFFIPIPVSVSDSSTITDVPDVVRNLTRDIPTPSEGLDYISLENNSFLLQENSSKTLLENSIPLAVTENITAYSEGEFVFDASTVTDSVSLSIVNFINIFDSSTASESDIAIFTFVPPNIITFVEFVTPTENSNVQSGLMYNLSVLDSSTVTDIAGTIPLVQPKQIVLIEFTPVAESITMVPNVPIVIFDSSITTDVLTVAPIQINANIFDSSQVTEQTPYQIIQQESLANFPTTGTIKDNASWQAGGWIQLTSAINNQHGEFEYSGTLPSSFEVLFDVNVVGQADATYFYWGCSRTPISELDNAGGYIFALKETLGSGTPYLWEFNGTQIANQGSINWVDSNWHTVRLEIVSQTLTTYLDNVQQFTFTDPTVRTLGGNIYGYGARTGGQNAIHLIRNTQVTTLAPVKVIETIFAPIILDSSAVTDIPTVEKIEESIISDSSTVTDVVTKILLATTISTSDSSTVTENITAYSEGEFVFDASTVTDVPMLQITNFLSISDSSTVTESTTVEQVYIILFDAISGEPNIFVTEDIQIFLTFTSSTFDTSTVTESITILYGQLDISLSDSSTITENVVVQTIYPENIADNSTVSENITVFLPYLAEVVFDSSTVTEGAPILIISPYKPTASDLSIVIDNVVQILLTNNINVFDTSAVTESVTVTKINIISASDPSTTTDVVTQILLINTINIAEVSAVTEQIFFNTIDFETLSDSSIVTDVPTVIQIYYSIVFDSAIVTDVVTQILLINTINVFDSSIATENITVLIPILYYNVFDSSAVDDITTLEVIDFESLSDSSTATDIITQILLIDFLSIFDSSMINDNTITVETIETESLSENSTVTDTLAQILLIDTVGLFDSSTVTESIVMEMIDFESLSDSSTVTDTITILIPILKYSVFDSSKVTDVPLVEPFYFNNAPLYYGLDTGEISIMLGDNKMPMWNNIENRPTNPPIGAFGFNYTAGQLEIWDGKSWKKVALT